jgi:hypothetical protein
MTTNHSRGRERHDRGTLLAGLIALTALAAAVLLAISLAPASAETPAERCKRETTAYNNAWKNSWAASHPGKKPSDAPKPPVPYKCGGNNDGPPPTVQPTTTSPEVPSGTTAAPTAAPDNSGPAISAPTTRRDIQHPGTGQPPIGSDGDRVHSDSLPPMEPIQYVAARSVDEARLLIDEIARKKAAGEPIGQVKYGPCTLYPHSLHVRTRTKDNDPRLVGFKPQTKCEHRVLGITQTSRIRYKYYAWWLNVNLRWDNPQVSGNTNQSSLQDKKVEFICAGTVDTAFVGTVEGEMIDTNGEKYYATTATSVFREHCEI